MNKFYIFLNIYSLYLHFLKRLIILLLHT
jgi:hypothetical protein